VVCAVMCELVSSLRTGIFSKSHHITGFWRADDGRPPEISLYSPLVAPVSSHFAVILQNRRLKRENSRCEAQHGAFVTSEQVTTRRESHRSVDGSSIA
jgi:hypothetical protein